MMDLHEVYMASRLGAGRDDSRLAEESAYAAGTLGCKRKNLLKLSTTEKTISGVTFTVNSDGSVTANGTATAIAWLSIELSEPLVGRYILSGCPAGGSWNTYGIVPYRGSTALTKSDYGRGAEIQFDGTIDSIRLRIAANQVCTDLTFRPMLRDARITDDTFEPYKPSVDERLKALEDAIAGN